MTQNPVQAFRNACARASYASAPTPSMSLQDFLASLKGEPGQRIELSAAPRAYGGSCVNSGTVAEVEALLRTAEFGSTFTVSTWEPSGRRRTLWHLVHASAGFYLASLDARELGAPQQCAAPLPRPSVPCTGKGRPGPRSVEPGKR